MILPRPPEMRLSPDDNVRKLARRQSATDVLTPVPPSPDCVVGAWSSYIAIKPELFEVTFGRTKRALKIVNLVNCIRWTSLKPTT